MNEARKVGREERRKMEGTKRKEEGSDFNASSLFIRVNVRMYVPLDGLRVLSSDNTAFTSCEVKGYRVSQ